MMISLGRHIRKFRKNDDGVVAVEFILLALPFFLTLFAIMETALSHTAQQVISNATDRLSRDIRTGVINPVTLTEAEFKNRLCNEISTFFPSDCPDLHVDVREYASYGDVPKAISYTPGGKIDSSDFQFTPGGRGSINSMQVLYAWPVVTDMMKSRLSNLEDGRILLFASSTWRNEP